MDKLHRLSKTSLYFTFFTRIKAASVASLLFIIVSKSDKDTYTDLVLSSKFYVSGFYGMLLAVVVIEYIRLVNILFDYWCHWRNWRLRLLCIVSLGVIPIAWIDRLLFKFVVEHIAKKSYASTGFDQTILPLVTLMIFLAHIALYLWQRRLYRKQEKFDALPANIYEVDELSDNITLHKELNIKPLDVDATLDTNTTIPDMPAEQVAMAPEEVEKTDPHDRTPWTTIDCLHKLVMHTFQLTDVCYLNAGIRSGQLYLKDGRNFDIFYTRKKLRSKLNPLHFAEAYTGQFYALEIIGSIEERLGKETIVVKAGCRKDMPMNISRRFSRNFREAFSRYLVDNPGIVNKNI